MTQPAPTDHRERLQNALLAIQTLQAKVDALGQARSEPVAVIGLACRFPGRSYGPAAFWRLLRDGQDAITDVPASRWAVDDHFDADPDAPGKSYSRWGGFIEDVDRFDPHFFGISPREAVSLDPQHRLLLELGWAALENAGVAPGSLGGSRTGVFIGITGSDYAQLVKAAGPEKLNAYSAIGSTSAFVAGRLSYTLGLQGPSVAMDTACSSSLSAVHLACQSLRSRDCAMALAGGVNLMLTPEMFVTTSKNRMLSPTGRCRTFDAAADGFVRGEGAGVVVLKRLSSALADGDPVLAVIRGSAMNQDGATSGLTVPNKLAQEAVIRDALAAAGVQPHEVDYVEAHGTGTALGDPIELRALGAVLAEGRDAPFLVGSVKTNVGHLEAASGIAGLIKVILMLRHGEIAPHLHFERPTPHVPWDEIPAAVPTAARSWPRGEVPRIAGVSSFGASGTNVHLVVEEAPASATRGPSAAPAGDGAGERPALVLVLSARSEVELQAQVGNFRDLLAGAGEPATAGGAHDATPGSGGVVSLEDVCHTAAVGRTHFAHRLAVVEARAAEMVERLDGFLVGEEQPAVVKGEVRPGARPKVAFLFTGQGSQYVGMGRELFETEPRFRETLERCDEILRPFLERPLLSVLYPPAGGEEAARALLDATGYTQPALFAMEYALAELWRSWGIEPYAVIGHSVGEYVAACVAGVFSLEDGLRLIAERARLMQALPAGGRMVAVRAGEAVVAGVLAPFAATVSIAALNGPESVVISGAAEQVDAMVGALRERGIDCRPLSVSHAFHSPLLDPVLDALEDAMRGVAMQRPRLRLVSNLTGELAGAELTHPGYWRRHARQPVLFARGVRTLAELGCDAFLEIGPHPVLLGMARQCLPDDAKPAAGSASSSSTETGSAGEGEMAAADADPPPAIRDPGSVWVPSLRRDKGDYSAMLGGLARLHVAGAPVDWAGFDAGRLRRRVWLPTYPFAGGRYWIEPGSATPLRLADLGDEVHPLLGQALRTAGRQRIFEAWLGADQPAFLADHRVHGVVLLPAAAFLEMALAAGEEVLGGSVAALEGMVLHEPLRLGDEPSTVQILVTPQGEGAAAFEIHSLEGEGEAASWRLHASGTARLQAAAAGPNLDETRGAAEPPEELSSAAHYAALAVRGLDFGAAFRGVQCVRRGAGAAVAEARLPEALAPGASAYRLHPALLDACLQAVAAALDTPGATYLPLGFERVALRGELQGTVVSRATLRPRNGGVDTLAADLVVHDADGRRVLEIEGIALRAVAGAALGASRKEHGEWLYDVVWEPQLLLEPVPEPSALHPLPELLAPAAAHLAELAASTDSALLAALQPRLDRACASYAAQALRSLGWTPARGETVCSAELAERLDIHVRYRRLLARLLETFAEDGWLERAGEGWHVVGEPDYPPAADLLAALRSDFPDCAADLAILERCGAALPAALRGERDPLELLFPAGSLAEAERMYRDSPLTRGFNALVATTVASLLEALPAGRSLRVLEIGGGTGGTTAHVLPHLPADQVEYHFTDVSPLFTERAKSKFAAFPFVQTRPLDIAADPAEQGFAAESFDLILAANVLHATPDLRATLRRVRRLLAPGGTLVLLEGVARQRFADLTVGLTDGWWCYADDALRDYALVDQGAWLRLLREHDLEPAAIRGDGPFATQAVLVARSADSKAHDGPGTWLILRDEGGVGAKLAARLRAGGNQCVVVRPVPPSPAEVRRGEVSVSGQASTGGEAAEMDLATNPPLFPLSRLWERGPGGEGPLEPGTPTEPGEVPLHLVPTDPTAFRDLLERTLAHRPPLRGVVHLWALDDAEPPFPSPRASGGDERTRLSDASLARVEARVTGSALHLIQALAATGATPRVWFVTRGAQAVTTEEPCDPLHAALWGLGKVVALEHPELRCVRVDLDPAGDDLEEGERLHAELRVSGDEDQIALRGDDRRVARLARRADAPASLPLVGGQPYGLATVGAKVLDDLRLLPLERRAPAAGEVEVEVRATGLAFRDVLNALGRYPGPEVPLGGDFSGVVSAVGEGVEGLAVGDAVIGMAPGAFATFVTARAELVARKPAGISMAEAAGIPSAFLTAHHALLHLAGLRAGERVLVHAGAGGVGLAAIRLAQRLGAEVLATAGSPSKRAYLASLGVAHVFDSRSLDFAAEVLRATGGRGVDVVLNSLADDFIPKSLECLAEDGRFVELGKRGIWDAARVAELRPGVAYSVVDLAASADREPGLIRRLFDEVLGEFEDGSLRPLPVKVFPMSEAVSAFRFMAQARHVGRIVLTHHVAPAVRADTTYLITGGLGGVGLSTARWLVERGARHLVLVGRRPPSDAARKVIDELERSGARVLALQADVARAEDVDRVLGMIGESLPPLRGVFHGALVLDDGALVQQSWKRFAAVFAPRVLGAWLLHERTKSLPLDFFVLHSAAGAVLGSAGQANYSAANAFLGALAHHRRALGLPAQSMQWGVWSGVGRAAESGADERLAQQGIGTMTPAQALAAMEAALNQVHAPPEVAVMRVDWPTWLRSGARERSPFFSRLAAETRAAARSRGPEAKPPPPTRALRRELDEAPAARRPSLLAAHVRAQVARVLSLDAERAVDARQPLQELGLDSLMAVELRTLLAGGLELRRALPATLAFDYPTVEAITGYLVKELYGAAPAANGVTGRAAIATGAAVEAAAVAELTEEEAEALLLQELEAMPESGG